MTAKVSCLKGQSATAELFNSATAVTSIPGMAEQAVLDVVGTQILVSKHSGVFGSGVVITESDTRYLEISRYFNTGSDPYAGTILYRLDPSLQFTPTLSIESGHFNIGSDPTVLVVGWISYPGGGVSSGLTSNMLYSAQVAEDFKYLDFVSARGIVDALDATTGLIGAIVPASNTWFAAQMRNQYQVVMNTRTHEPTNKVVVYVEEYKNEYWVVFENTALTGTAQAFDIELFAHSNDTTATSVHSRLACDVGVVTTMGIIYRGTSEIALSSGGLRGPLSRGVFSTGLVELDAPKRETLRVKYHVSLPAGKTFRIASVGIGNESFFGAKASPDA